MSHVHISHTLQNSGFESRPPVLPIRHTKDELNYYRFFEGRSCHLVAILLTMKVR